MTPFKKLRSLLEDPGCSYILEAHNALSAQIAEASGAPGVWASSLTLSASFGMRDNSELTMTQVLELLETMTTRIEVPVLFDGDTGYGQFSHFQQLVKKLCARQVGGVCIEDKIFPKTNSFLQTEKQVLAPVDEFCGKLRAGKDAQTDSDFVVVARTEALIAGLDVTAALERAEQYVEAGADAVLVHSKARTFAPLQEFMSRWKCSAPVICVPTTYYSTPVEAFEQAGIAMVIWANHMLRASVNAMQRAAKEIATTGTARGLEDEIAPVKELFRLQDTDGLTESERIYGQSNSSKAVILAATRGSGLDELTRDRPKAMIPVNGEPAIEKQLRHLRAEGLHDISVVRGYKPEALKLDGVTFFENPRWAETGEVGSLAEARSQLKGDVVIAFGDVLFKRYILHELMASDAPITIVVDGSRSFLEDCKNADRVKVSGPPPTSYDEGKYHLVSMSTDLPDNECDGEWIGLARLKGEGTQQFCEALDETLDREDGDLLEVAEVFNRLVQDAGTPVRVLYIHRDWIDINSVVDVAKGISS